MQSCIYEGRVSHTRLEPVKHRFDYRLFMMYVDLDELPTLFSCRWFWSSHKSALARFRRERHLGEGDLKAAVQELVFAQLGFRPSGPVRLLTNFAYFGYWFNPVSFYYCFEDDGETVAAIVVEVNNTPWGEQHCYVESCRDFSTNGRPWRFEIGKKMHVSPFMPMNVNYTWVLKQPADRLSVFMANRVAGNREFKAMLNLKRKEITTWSLARVLLRFPMQTASIIFRIHWQALRLWLKGVPVVPHPDHAQTAVDRQ